MTYLSPFTRHVDLTNGAIPDAPLVQTRRLSDLRGLFADPAAEERLTEEDPVLYRVYEAASEVPKEEGQLLFSTTVIEPGKVGDEYFMTKGHFHAKGDRAELYYGLSGMGYLLLQTPEGKVDAQAMRPGAASYVPPYWGHRTVNTGNQPFAFLAVYPADAGYDYRTIAEEGFAAILVERRGKPELAPNPRHKGAGQ